MKVALLVDKKERTYAYKLSNMFDSCEVRLLDTEIKLQSTLRQYCIKNNIDAICSAQLFLNRKIADTDNPSIGDLAGSLYKFYLTEDKSIDFLCLNSLKLLHTQAYQPFLFKRYLSKLTYKQRWLTANKFNYSIVDYTDRKALLALFDSAMFVAVDIETDRPLKKGFAHITCCGYTAVNVSGDELVLTNVVLPITCLENVKLMRELNAHKVKKCLQNGKYDSAYFYVYSAPLTNYLLDTANMHHSWYSELPKDLGTLAAFYVREYNSWKGKVHEKTKDQLYLYNAKDTYYTALVAIAWLKDSPSWAKANYATEFPIVFPSHLAEMTGIAVDKKKFKHKKSQLEHNIATLNTRLDKLLGVTNFNVNSYKAVRELLQLLTNKKQTKSDKNYLTEIAGQHPLNALIIELLIKIRKERKLLSTYFKSSIMLQNTLSEEVSPRLVYTLNPHGTDTGRLSSSSHHFWVGSNIQNIPRGESVKPIFVADEGYLLCEIDYAQAESRGTGYIVGETALINAVESDSDFHKLNATMFFGVPYDQVSENLRQLAKPVNHGANYNMGAWVLIEQMGGTLAVLKAGKLLGLPANYTAKNIADHLLRCFDTAYPKIRSKYHEYLKQCVMTTKKLVGATGWTRYCFGNPTTNKLHLNAYVAHCPQSLNAMMLNKAVLRMFKEVWLKHPQQLRFVAQIHDSILFQYRKDSEYLVKKVADCMHIPIDVTDISQVTRTLVVPTDIKLGLTSWG